MKKRPQIPSLARRFAEVRDSDVVVRDGKVTHAIRPRDRELALSLATSLVGKPSDDAHIATFHAIIESQPYTYLGLLGRDAQILDPVSHLPIGQSVDGDSFVSFDEPMGLRPGDPFPNAFAPSGWRPDVAAVAAGGDGEHADPEASRRAAEKGDAEEAERIELLVTRRGIGSWQLVATIASAEDIAAFELGDLADLSALKLLRTGRDGVLRHYEFFRSAKVEPLLRDGGAQLRMLIDAIYGPVEPRDSEP